MLNVFYFTFFSIRLSCLQMPVSEFVSVNRNINLLLINYFRRHF